MAKKPTFPQTVRVINQGLHYNRISADQVEIRTDLGIITVSSDWWQQHHKAPAFLVQVNAISVPRGKA